MKGSEAMAKLDKESGDWGVLGLEIQFHSFQ